MAKDYINKYRNVLRQFEREIFFQNISSCCNGVTMAQCHTLLEVQNNKQVTVTELARNLNLDKSTVSRTIDSLVKSGMVDRVVPIENRRITTINLTESGEKTVDDINWNNSQYIQDTLFVLNDHEKDELLKLFEKITSRMIQIRKR